VDFDVAFIGKKVNNAKKTIASHAKTT